MKKMSPYYYVVLEVKRVVDGDTVDLVLDQGFGNTVTARFRMKNYDAPETWRPKTDEELIAGKKVTEALKKILTREMMTKNLYCKSSKDLAVYGRYECLLFFKGTTGTHININEMMLKYMLDHNLTKEEVRKSLTE